MRAELDDRLDVIADALDQQVQDVPAIIVQEDHEHEKHADSEADLAEPPDADFKPADHGEGRQGGDAPDDDDLVGSVFFDVAVESLEAAVELNHTQAEARAHSEHRTDNGNRVDQVAQQAVNPVAEQGVEAGADGHG